MKSIFFLLSDVFCSWTSLHEQSELSAIGREDFSVCCFRKSLAHA